MSEIPNTNEVVEDVKNIVSLEGDKAKIALEDLKRITSIKLKVRINANATGNEKEDIKMAVKIDVNKNKMLVKLLEGKSLEELETVQDLEGILKELMFPYANRVSITSIS